MERRTAPHLLAPLRASKRTPMASLACRAGAPFRRGRARALRRSIAASRCGFQAAAQTSGPRFLGRGLAGVTRGFSSPCPSPVEAPHAAVVMPPGRCPETSRVRGDEPRPRAPHHRPRDRTKADLMKIKGPLRGAARPGISRPVWRIDGRLSARSASPPPRVSQRHCRDAPRHGARWMRI